MPEALEISLLGPPRVRSAGRPVAFDTRKATALLAHLALAGRPRSRAALCELLWPGYDPDHARGALRRTLSALRKAIGEGWIETGGDSVALREGVELVVDVSRFRALAGTGSPDALAEAVALFGGELLEGFWLRDSAEFEAWQAHEAELLERELAGALGRLVRLLAARGEYGRAIPHARRWLVLDPLHEPAHRELIRLYALNGDRAAALAQYRDCVRTLNEELGVSPLEDTIALFEQVSDGTLTGAAPASPAPQPPAARAPAPRDLPLVGRADALEALLDAHAAAAPDGRLALVEGEAGIGKTRLAGELAAAVSVRGGVVLAGRCHDDEAGVPYGPVVDLLRTSMRMRGEALAASAPAQRLADASLLLPDLRSLSADRPAPVGLSDPGARARLLEGVATVLAAAAGGARPGLVLVDDVDTADEASLDAFVYLARRLHDRALLVALTFRTERVPPGHRLRRVAAELMPAGATIVTLARLRQPEVTQLVRSAAPAAGPELEERIFVESEGLPLFVVEYLAALAAGSEPGEELMGRELRDLLATRLAGLDGPARQVLETAAVIGRSFDLRTVRAASGRSEEETADGLQALTGRGLVRELSAAEPSYDFTHDKLRALAYEQMGRARRRLLHGRVADALLRAASGAESASPVAQHLRLAGDDARAAEHHRRAADHAASVLAHGEALAHLDAALELGVGDAAAVHERMGDLRTLVGDYAGALASYESAAAAAAAADVARIEHKLGGVHQRRGERERAEARYTVALEALAPGDDGLRARILTDLSLTLYQAGRAKRASELAGDARVLAEAAGDELARAQAHNLLGVLARGERRLDVARAELERSIALAEQLGDGSAHAAALNNLALVARDAGELDRALELTERALRVCAAEGDRHREAALENNLADLHHAAGRPDDAMKHLKRAVALFSEVGGDERARLPEVWKLVSW